MLAEERRPEFRIVLSEFIARPLAPMVAAAKQAAVLGKELLHYARTGAVNGYRDVLPFGAAPPQDYGRRGWNTRVKPRGMD